MDISDIVSTDYVELPADERVSKLVGSFSDPDLRGVVVTNDGDYEGVVTRRQLATSHHKPHEKLASIVRPVPRVARDEDVRETARLMIDGDTRIVPVFDGDQLVGVVTADDLLLAVEPHLDAVTVEDSYTQELITVEPDDKFSEALHELREHQFTHLPVMDAGVPVGIVSLYDVVDITIRDVRRSQGGSPSGIDSHGGPVSESAARTHGGFGNREGERKRILDMPVRDVMVSPVESIPVEATLQDAVELMFDNGISSLIVEGEGGPAGIVTKTDVLDALTWEAEESRTVELYGSDLLDDTTYDDVASMIDKFDDRDRDMSVLGAKVHLQRHEEQRRGTHLVLARIRMTTDRGQFIASGEGYGAKQALNEARDVLERRVRDERTHGDTKKHPNQEFWNKRFGWWLED
jgi:CBS domain-containing protein